MVKFMVKLALIAVVFVLGCSSSDPGNVSYYINYYLAFVYLS